MKAREKGGRVVGIGTTVVRALETAASSEWTPSKFMKVKQTYS